MKIVIIGGTGLIGTQVVDQLRQLDHLVLAAAPSTGVNTITGEGLATALKETDILIDLSNSPSFEDAAVMDFFRTSGNNLMAAAKAAGVKHHLALSIIGADRLSGGYMKAKVVQENIIKASGVPYTIIRATQFFEFLQGISYAATQGNEVHLSTVSFQPIAAADVADFVVRLALENPKNTTVAIAGPDRSTLDVMAAKYLNATHDSRNVIPNSNDEYFGSNPVGQALVPHGDVLIGQQTFANWLSQLQPVSAK